MNIETLDFAKNGYRQIDPESFRDISNYKVYNTWYKVTKDCKHLCKLNDKLQFVIRETLLDFPGMSFNLSYQIGMVHEDKDSEWLDIRIYSLDKEDMSNLHRLENKLLRMWVAANED